MFPCFPWLIISVYSCLFVVLIPSLLLGAFVFTGAAVHFVFEQAAFDIGVVEGDFPAGPQADFFAQLGISGKDIAGITGTFLLEEVTNAAICFFQFFDFA